MLIANTGQSLVVMNLRTGEQVQLPPGQRTPVLDSKIPFIDDSFVLISLFNAGVLVAYTDAGAAHPGFPTTTNPADSKRIPPVDADYAAAVVKAGDIRRSNIVRARPFLVTGNDRQRTAFLTRRALGHFDYVQLVVYSQAALAANTLTASIAPSAKWNDGFNPVTSADAAIAPTAFTWGSTDTTDFKNPGGGSANTTTSGGSGSTADDTIYGAATSDWLAIRSLDRADVVGAPPLYMLRLHSSGNTPAAAITEANSASSNPFSAADPEFFSGYFNASSTDKTLTNGVAETPVQGYVPSVELKYILRDKRALCIAHASDSLGKGWVASTAVPQWGGNADGWGRKLVRKLNLSGVPAEYVNLAQQNFKSFRFHEALYDVLLKRPNALTHAIIKVWSTNESSDGVASIAPAIQRTNKLIAMCQERGVIPIIEHLWAGQSWGTPGEILVRSYCAQLNSAGIRVFDASQIIGGPQLQSTPLSQYLTRDSGGSVVDNIHINEAGHEDVANEAMRVRGYLGLI